MERWRERDYEGQISKTNFWLEGVQGEWDTFYTPHLPERNERIIKIIIQIYIQIHETRTFYFYILVEGEGLY